MPFIELVCTTCAESRYKSKIDIGPELKLTPEMFIPLGDQPDASTYKDGPLCYNCNGVLRPMPIAEKKKLQREEAAALREQRAAQKAYQEDLVPSPPTTDASLVQTIFECGPDEGNMEMTTLPDGRVLVKTSRRLFILNLKEALGV
jgi:hypothetical protein